MIDVSVVVPVYGVEKYVERCVRSLFEQTLTQGVEFIFVDDCTPDNSIGIIQQTLKEYPHRADQVRILHHEQNRGLPQARKTGIEAANGEYICNVDSDDWLELSALDKMYRHAVENSADIVAFDMYYSNDTQCIANHRPFKTDNILDEMIYGRVGWSLCSKLIRRRLYFNPNAIVFPHFHMAEDLFQMFQLGERSKKSVYLSENLYHYYWNPQSQSKNPDKVRRDFKMMRDNIEHLIEIRDGERHKGENDWLRMQAKVMLYPLLEIKGGRKEYLEGYHELNWRILFNQTIPIKSKLRHLGVLLGIHSVVESGRGFIKGR
ncbi:MAG: glycosyltransferase [Muribaculaceae bacterium]|nr:glycosyltransferase [Muribaculaceae bacterium]